MPDQPLPRPPVDGAVLRAFVAASTAAADRVLLDDHTWDDLDMDAVAERLDRFADDFTDDDARFDHRIRAGPATGRNAIRLLERLGYPSELVASARSRL